MAFNKELSLLSSVGEHLLRVWLYESDVDTVSDIIQDNSYFGEVSDILKVGFLIMFVDTANQTQTLLQIESVSSGSVGVGLADASYTVGSTLSSTKRTYVFETTAGVSQDYNLVMPADFYVTDFHFIVTSSSASPAQVYLLDGTDNKAITLKISTNEPVNTIVRADWIEHGQNLIEKGHTMTLRAADGGSGNSGSLAAYVSGVYTSS